VSSEDRTKRARSVPHLRSEERTVADSDAELFRDAVRGAKPLKRTRDVAPRPKPPPRARFTRADEAAVLEESLRFAPGELAAEIGDELQFHRSGVSETLVRQLRRGAFRVDREIDLHGLNLRDAHAALAAFLSAAVARDARCVRIVHGKGRRSGPRGPVLKNMVSTVLRKTQAVVAFASARPVDGGTGALYVLLAR
jgi:DNA-nicking Smr family endonuclease